MRDKLEVGDDGERAVPRPIHNRVATILITLPVKFEGRADDVLDMDRHEEQFEGPGGLVGDIEWTESISDCEYKI